MTAGSLVVKNRVEGSARRGNRDLLLIRGRGQSLFAFWEPLLGYILSLLPFPMRILSSKPHIKKSDVQRRTKLRNDNRCCPIILVWGARLWGYRTRPVERRSFGLRKGHFGAFYTSRRKLLRGSSTWVRLVGKRVRVGRNRGERLKIEDKIDVE